ncbi:MAG: replication initiation factor domain-containing protein [Erysipelotrichaceae bacterium]|nr:replication initiation factor domain-containing protein [Erysipelotrichaceae bacterium]
MSYTISSCFDWFQCVFDHIPYYDTFDINLGKPKSYIELDELLKLLEIPERFINFMCDLEQGFHGFKYRVSLVEGINLLLFGPRNKNDKFTTLLQVTGVGCRYLLERKLWFNLFNYCNQLSAKYTRLDPATDILGDYPLNMWVMYNCINDGYFKSIYSKGYIITGQPPKNEEEAKVKPLTIYAGKKGTSSSFTRIYNKAVEQGLDPLAEPWMRIEMQIQDHSKITCIINAFLLAYEEDNLDLFNSVVLGTLNDFLTLLDEEGNVHPLWSKLLEDIKAIEILSSPKSTNSFDTCCEWFKRSCSRFLAMYTLINGENELYKLVEELAYSNMAEFERKSLNCVNEKLSTLGYNTLTLNYVKSIGKQKINN